ncbi:MAG: Ivy family c-type lysozyme inhibitor [Acetobacter sp.]
MRQPVFLFRGWSSLLLACALASYIPLYPALAEDAPYASDLSHMPQYAPAYHAMMQLPDWARTGAAVSAPVGTINLAGHAYVVGHLCKPHDCADNQMEVIFARDGKAGWGLLTYKSGRTLYQMPFGDPDDTILAALHASYRANNPGSS